MPKFISDADMALLESEQPKKKFISDKEMSQMTSSSIPLDKFEEQVPDVSMFESGVRGVAQGATLGFADELAGALEATKETLLSPEAKSWLDEYKRSRDESRAAYKAAEEANPTTYGISEMGGAIGSALVPVGLAAKGVAGVGKLAQLGTKIQGAIGAGALAGAGTSEADLTKPDLESLTELGGDVGTGATLGALSFGAAKALPIGFRAIRESDPVETFLSSRKFAKRGESVFGKTAREKIGKEIVDLSENIGKEISEKYGNTGKAIFEETKRATDSGDIVKLNDVLEFAEKNLPDLPETLPEWKTAKSRIQTLINETIKKSPQMSPKEATAFEKAIGQLAYDKDLKSPQIQSFAERLRGMTGSTISKDIPGLGKLKQESRELIKALKIIGIEDIKGDSPEELMEHIQKIAPQIQRMASETGAGSISKERFSKFIEQIGKVYPEMADQFAIAASEAAEKSQIMKGQGLGVKSISRTLGGALGSLEKELGFPGTKAVLPEPPSITSINPKLKSLIKDVYKTTGIKPKDIPGAAIGRLGAIYSTLNQEDVRATEYKPDEFKKWFGNLKENDLKLVADRFKNDPSLESLGRKLENAVNSGSSIEKAQAEFQIQQNTKARQLLNK